MRFLVITISVSGKAKPARQRSERWALNDQRQQDNGKGDEHDLRARRKWRPRRGDEWKCERNDQGVAATHPCPSDEGNPAPRRKLQCPVTEPCADHATK